MDWVAMSSEGNYCFDVAGCLHVWWGNPGVPWSSFSIFVSLWYPCSPQANALIADEALFLMPAYASFVSTLVHSCGF